MSQRHGQRAGKRRGVTPGATSNGTSPEPVLAKLGPVELSEFAKCQQAVIDARQAAADAELELQHMVMVLRQRHGWKEPNVKIHTATGEVTPWVPGTPV